MAARAQDAVAIARGLIGTPYAKLDCIGLIVKIIRTAAGGDKKYRTAGTNTLWRSLSAAPKYRDLIRRQEGLIGARAGMLAFKARGTNVHHVGLVTGEGTVIHSSSAQQGRGVAETPLSPAEGWTHLGEHRLISIGEERKMEGNGVVRTAGGKLNVREMPEGRIIAQIPNGSEVEILGEDGDWLRVHFGEERSGYVFAAYIERKAQSEAAQTAQEAQRSRKTIRITDENGDIYDVAGAFTVRVLED